MGLWNNIVMFVCVSLYVCKFVFKSIMEESVCESYIVITLPLITHRFKTYVALSWNGEQEQWNGHFSGHKQT